MAGPLQRFVPSKSAQSATPLQGIELPPMPERLRKIAPELAEWEASLKRAIQDNFRRLEEKLNAVIDAQKTGQ